MTAPLESPPQSPAPPPPPAQPKQGRRTTVIVGGAALVLGILLGTAMGGNEPTDDDSADRIAALEAELADAEERAAEQPSPDDNEALAAAESALDDALDAISDLESANGELAAQIEALEGKLAELEDQPPPPADEVEPTQSPDGIVQVGSYEFADVQISRDGLGDFSARARVTNTGSSAEGVIFKLTVFKSGSVVGTADGIVNGFDAGSTQTVEFISVDDYTDWDDFEVQIELEF